MTVIVDVNKYAARRYHVNPSRGVGRVRNPVHISGHTTTGAPNRSLAVEFGLSRFSPACGGEAIAMHAWSRD